MFQTFFILFISSCVNLKETIQCLKEFNQILCATLITWLISIVKKLFCATMTVSGEVFHLEKFSSVKESHRYTILTSCYHYNLSMKSRQIRHPETLIWHFLHKIYTWLWILSLVLWGIKSFRTCRVPRFFFDLRFNIHYADVWQIYFIWNQMVLTVITYS